MGRTPTNKHENYALYHAGTYGNHLKFWESIEAFQADQNWDWNRPVALRTKSKPGIELPDYCSETSCERVHELANQWCNLGIKLEDIVLNEIGPDEAILIQGEVMRSPYYLDLRCSREKLMMRQALAKKQEHFISLSAVLILQTFMDADSLENLQRLLDEYDDAIIEFSTYSKPVGVLQHNTVIWEVRNY